MSLGRSVETALDGHPIYVCPHTARQAFSGFSLSLPVLKRYLKYIGTLKFGSKIDQQEKSLFVKTCTCLCTDLSRCSLKIYGRENYSELILK
jgi:hypothetical protein